MVDNKKRRLPRQLPENKQQENFTHFMLSGSNSTESKLIADAGQNQLLIWQDHPTAGSNTMKLNVVSSKVETTTYSDSMSKYPSDEAWSKSGGVSLDGLFIPFSTNFVVKSDNGSTTDKNKPKGNLPSYERPYSTLSNDGNVVDTQDTAKDATHPLLGASAPSPKLITSVSLNPYASGHQIANVNKGSTLPSNNTLNIDSQVRVDKYPQDIPTLVSAPESSNEVQRPMALRGPLVLAGWGYDTNGLPVPNMKYDAEYKEGDPTLETFGEQKYTPAQMKAYDSEGNKNDHKHFIPNHLARQDKWKVGPVDLRWDRQRKVWTAAGGGTSAPVNLFLCKAAKCILPKAGIDGNNSFNLGVGGNINSPGRLYRNPCPTQDCNYTSYFPTSIYYPDISIYDPEDHNWCGLCKTFGNVTACGDFADACSPFYDALIIRKLSEDLGETDKLKECTDKFRKAEGGNPHARRAGNPCHGWGSSYFGKPERISEKIAKKDWTEAAKDILYERVFIDNPLGQGLMVGDSFFSYDTGRRISHTYVKSEKPGCGTQGGKKISVTETIAVHAILQAEFYGMEIISHAGCDRGEMAACSRKFFAQGFATGEDCGPDDDYVVTSTAYSG